MSLVRSPQWLAGSDVVSCGGVAGLGRRSLILHGRRAVGCRAVWWLMGLLAVVGVVGLHLNCAGVGNGPVVASDQRVLAISGGVLLISGFLSDKKPLVCKEPCESCAPGVENALLVQCCAGAPACLLQSDGGGSICVQGGDAVAWGQRVSAVSGGVLLISGFLSDKKPLVCEELCESCATGVGGALSVRCSTANPACVGSGSVQGGDAVAWGQRVPAISGGVLLISGFLSDKKPLVCEELCESCASEVGDALLARCSAADPACDFTATVAETVLAIVVEDGSTRLGEFAVAASVLSSTSRECDLCPGGLPLPTAGAAEFMVPTIAHSVRHRSWCRQLSVCRSPRCPVWGAMVIGSRLHGRGPETKRPL